MGRATSNAVDPYPPDPGDPFHYGRSKSSEKERDTEWVERLRSKKLPVREQFSTMLSDTAPRPKPVVIPERKSAAEIHRQMRQLKRARLLKKRKGR